MPRNGLATPKATPFETYLHDINEVELLTAEEERALAQEIAQGNIEAAHRMTRANLRLVVSIARRYVGKGLDLQDLIEEGNMGLMTAVEAYNPDFGTRFSTYASYWIKQNIKRALIWQGRHIRIPDYLVEFAYKWENVATQLHAELGRPPTDEEVGAEIGISGKKLKRKLKVMRQAASIRMDHGSDDFDPLEEVRDRQEDAAADPMDIPVVLGYLDELDKRAAYVLRMRFGLDGNEPLTLQEIGAIIGVTREMVRQIERKALRQLREKVEGVGE